MGNLVPSFSKPSSDVYVVRTPPKRNASEEDQLEQKKRERLKQLEEFTKLNSDLKMRKKSTSGNP